MPLHQDHPSCPYAISEATPLHVHETVLPAPYGRGVKTIRQLNDTFKTFRIWGGGVWTGDKQADGLVVTPAILAPPTLPHTPFMLH